MSAYLILGLVLFLGIHSVRIFASDWREAQVARLGLWPWKGVYALVSALGLGLIVWGYGLARADPVVLWAPPVWTRHLAALLTLPAFILLVAAYLPGSHIKAKVGHPMVAGTSSGHWPTCWPTATWPTCRCSAPSWSGRWPALHCGSRRLDRIAGPQLCRAVLVTGRRGLRSASLPGPGSPSGATPG
jgi:hypothetical protein